MIGVTDSKYLVTTQVLDHVVTIPYDRLADANHHASFLSKGKQTAYVREYGQGPRFNTWVPIYVYVDGKGATYAK